MGRHIKDPRVRPVVDNYGRQLDPSQYTAEDYEALRRSFAKARQREAGRLAGMARRGIKRGPRKTPMGEAERATKLAALAKAREIKAAKRKALYESPLPFRTEPLPAHECTPTELVYLAAIGQSPVKPEPSKPYVIKPLVDPVLHHALTGQQCPPDMACPRA